MPEKKFTVRIAQTVFYDVTLSAESEEDARTTVDHAINGDSLEDFNMVERDNTDFSVNDVTEAA